MSHATTHTHTHAAKVLPVAYGIMKLQITCVIEDDKVGTDFLEESITAFEDLVRATHAHTDSAVVVSSSSTKSTRKSSLVASYICGVAVNTWPALSMCTCSLSLHF